VCIPLISLAPRSAISSHLAYASFAPPLPLSSRGCPVYMMQLLALSLMYAPITSARRQCASCPCTVGRQGPHERIAKSPGRPHPLTPLITLVRLFLGSCTLLSVRECRRTPVPCVRRISSKVRAPESARKERQVELLEHGGKLGRLSNGRAGG
jgi:hypothetical protein